MQLDEHHMRNNPAMHWLERRRVWLDPAHGWQEVPVYDGADLTPGCVLDGPLLIEERTTTAFVGARDRLEVDSRDDFLVHVGARP